MKQQWRIPCLGIIASVALIIYLYQGQPAFFDPFLTRRFLLNPVKELYRHLCSFTAAFVLLGVLPAALACLLWDERPSEWALGLGPQKLAGFSVSLVMFAAMCPVLAYASDMPSFTVGHPLSLLATRHTRALVLYEGFLLLYVIGLEFYFRGFLLFGLRKELGNGAIYLQIIPYALMFSGRSQMEALAAIPAGIALGHLASRTNSIWYGVVVHWLCAVALDYLIIYRHF